MLSLCLSKRSKKRAGGGAAVAVTVTVTVTVMVTAAGRGRGRQESPAVEHSVPGVAPWGHRGPVPNKGAASTR